MSGELYIVNFYLACDIHHSEQRPEERALADRIPVNGRGRRYTRAELVKRNGLAYVHAADPNKALRRVLWGFGVEDVYGILKPHVDKIVQKGPEKQSSMPKNQLKLPL